MPTILEARAAYLAAAGLPADGGDSERWVKLKFGPIPFAFPNTASRKRAVRYHDIHHVVTGYSTDWVGEAEIGAWELASGCRGFPAAWLLDSAATFIGFFLGPRAVWRAFLRGRYTRNLYGAPLDESFLAQPVSAVRQRLGLDRTPPEASLVDRLAFARTLALCVLVNLGPGAVLVVTLVAALS